MVDNYIDRRIERQRQWPEALFRRLATLHLSEFFPLTDFPTQRAKKFPPPPLSGYCPPPPPFDILEV